LRTAQENLALTTPSFLSKATRLAIRDLPDLGAVKHSEWQGQNPHSSQKKAIRTENAPDGAA
jgi:hypothetical protein